MTIRELRQEARVWQEKLGLHEWTLIVRWGKQPPSGMEPDPTKFEMMLNCDGNALWSPENASALILIDKKAPGKRHTLVHELLHVRFEGHQPKPKKYDPLYERAINVLVAALLGEPEPDA